MITVAVTGGIGAGKSTVSAALRDRGAVVIDSDQLAREVVAAGTPGLQAVREEFGPRMIGPDGALDRVALAAVVFSDSAARARLEGITHPRVRARFTELQRQAPGDAVVVNDIPLLTTLSVAASFHLVIGVVADPDVRTRRLVGRGLSEADARARMASQLTDEERASLSDVIVHNHGEVAGLESAVNELWTGRLLPFEANTRTGRPALRNGGPELLPPDLRWPADGSRLAARVSAAVGGLPVDHIGPTAIPGMPAKDVIDLQLAVPDLLTADRLSADLTAAGFPGVPGDDRDTPHGGTQDRADDDPARWVERLHVNADPGRTLNLYLRVRDAPNWRWALLARDWLRAEPAERAAYLDVEQAANRHRAGAATDSADFSTEQWIDAAYSRGLRWALRTGWTPNAR